MQSENYAAPLFRAHMLGHGQKRKHSTGLDKRTAAPGDTPLVTMLPRGRVHWPDRWDSSEASTPIAERMLEVQTPNAEQNNPNIPAGDHETPRLHEDSILAKEASQTTLKARGAYKRAIPFPPRPSRASNEEQIGITQRLGGLATIPHDSADAALSRFKKNAVPSLFGEEVPADNYPWAGKDIEDKLTEHVIKNGLTSRAYVSGETNSANATFGSFLKQPSALQNMSTFLVAAMELRQEHRKVSAASTFKPPPRVTLTDTRREAWLRDLADNSIPLRRLSRTIPHGIRGRVLLDHCLEKSIPIKRAAWLAQCVGANEIRAFKRKGVSGAITTSNERKWVQEWTVTVEDFLESVLRKFTGSDDRAYLNYSLDLTQVLRSESLLDREHFIDWALSWLEVSTIAELPICLLIVRIIWQDLRLTFNFGRRLLSALIKIIDNLPRYHKVSHAERLSEQLIESLAGFVEDNRLCALLPTDWPTLRPLAHALRANPSIGPCIDQCKLLERTDHVTSIAFGLINNALNPKQCCLQLLDDCISLPKDLVQVDKLCSECLHLMRDSDSLLTALMQWSCSLFRSGECRVTLVRRLVVELSDRGTDVTDPLLMGLSKLKSTNGICAELVSQLLSQLARVGVFDVRRYLTWLMATGSLYGCKKDDVLSRCDLRFLLEIPIDQLSLNVSSTRAMLLRRSSIADDEGLRWAETFKAEVQRQLSGTKDDLKLGPFLGVEQRMLDPVSRAHVVDWMLNWIRRSPESAQYALDQRWSALSAQDKRIADPCYRHDAVSDSIQQSDIRDRAVLSTVMDILTKIHAPRALGQMIDACAIHFDMDTIALAASVILVNKAGLAAEGVILQTWASLLLRYRQIRQETSPDKSAITALQSIAGMIDIPNHIHDYLKQEINSAESNLVPAAFTPASEGTMEAAETNTLDSEDDIDRILSNASTLDPSSMRRVMALLTERLKIEECATTSWSCSKTLRLLSKLRSRGPDEYVRLLQEFLIHADTRTSFEEKLSLHQVLIGGYACTLDEVFQSSADGNDIAKYTYEFLALLLDLGGRSYFMEPTIRLHYTQQRLDYLLSNYEQVIISALTHLTNRVNDQEAVQKRQTEAILSSNELLELLAAALLRESKPVRRFLQAQCETPNEDVVAGFLRRLTNHSCVESISEDAASLHESGDGQLTKLTLAQMFPLGKVFQMVDELSLPFWKLIIQLRLASRREPKDLQEWRDEVLDAVKIVAMKQSTFWTPLLQHTGDAAAKEVFTFVSSIVVSPLKLKEITVTGSQIDEKRQHCFEMLRNTAFAVRSVAQPELAQKAISALGFLLNQWKDNSPSENENSTREFRISFCGYLQILLDLTLFLRFTFQKQSLCTDLLQLLCRFLATDISIHHPQTTQLIFDVAAFYTIDLETGVMLSVFENLPKLVRQNEAVQYLLGTSNSEGLWLHTAQQLPSQQRSGSGKPFSGEQSYGSSVVFPLRPWEMLPDAGPVVGSNDTALSLRLFDARKMT